MAVDFYINPQTGDLDLTNNIMRLTDSIEESSRQQVDITLNTYKGEFLFNTDFGIPWLRNDINPVQLLGEGNKQLIDLYVKEAILNRENITEIISYQSSVDPYQRNMTISFQAKTNSGDVVTVENITLTI